MPSYRLGHGNKAGQEKKIESQRLPIHEVSS